MDIFWQIVLANVLANSADVMNIYYSFLHFWKKYLSIVIFVLFWNTKIMELRWKLWVLSMESYGKLSTSKTNSICALENSRFCVIH